MSVEPARRWSIRSATTRARWVVPATIILFISCASPKAFGPYVQPRVDGPANASFAFLVVGDYGIANTAETAVAHAMEQWAHERPVDAFISTGDNVYPEAEPKYFEGAWTIPFGWVDEAGLPVIAALGNHDLEDRSSQPLIDFFDLPGAWYSRSIGPVEVFVLDANHPDDAEQFAWATEALKNSKARWKIVVVHKPPFDCARYSGEVAVRERYVPLFVEAGVALVLSGHDHNYQRFAPLNGVSYVVTGGGGDSLYGLSDMCLAETPSRLAGNDTMHHFLVLEGTAKQLVGFVIGTDGTVLDRFVLDQTQTETREGR